LYALDSQKVLKQLINVYAIGGVLVIAIAAQTRQSLKKDDHQNIPKNSLKNLTETLLLLK